MVGVTQKHPFAGESFGDKLEAIEATLVCIMEELFVDEDGYCRTEINARTLQPYHLDDPEVLPPEKQWIRHGLLPDCAKAIHMNYEDASMTTGTYMSAMVAKLKKTGDKKTEKIVRRTFAAMNLLYQEVAAKNAYGRGFIPKPYLGIRDVGEMFEMSADQWVKYVGGLDVFRDVATEPEREQAEEILVSMAKWLDDHDFVTPYLGGPVWGRLMQHEHYPAIFAYIMALGYRISGNDHFKQEAHFLLCKALEKEGDVPNWEGTAEPDINVQNLMTESLLPLMDFFPSLKPAMTKRLNWWWKNSNECQIQSDWSSMHHGVNLSSASLSACTYVQIRDILEPDQQTMDLDAVLLSQNSMADFMLMKNPEDVEVIGWLESRTSLWGQMMAAWLRAYWESR
jgi:hypothetical protein